jgi:hypothetical protein
MPPIGNPKANVGQMVDLRGPAPKIGFKFRESWTMDSQRTDRFTDSRGRDVPVTGSIRGDFENLYTILDVSNDEVIRYQMTVIKGEKDLAYVYPGGRKRTLDHIDELAGEVIVSQKAGDMWSHSLLEGQPRIEQGKALARLRSPFEERDHIPAGMQTPGIWWEVDATQIKRLLGGSVDAVSGKMQAQFVRLEAFRNEPCAVIEYRGTIRVRCEPEPDIPDSMQTCDFHQIIYRSIVNSITMRSDCNINFSSSGTMRLNGRAAQFQGRGHTRVAYLATVE